jgi:hypothetical protein
VRWREHRLLIAVYVAFAVLAFHESRAPGLGSIDAAQPPAWLLDPGRNIADVYAELYPERAASHYYRALQASLCTQVGPATSSECADFDLRSHREMRELLASAVATGNRSNERALYNYAVILLYSGAPPAEVDAVVRRWRRDYPYSALPDPRSIPR